MCWLSGMPSESNDGLCDYSVYSEISNLHWSFCLLDELPSLWPWRSMVKDSLMLSILAPYISCVCFWCVPDFVQGPIYHQVLCLCRVHPKKYVDGPRFVVFCWRQILADFMHILQDFFTDTGTHICNHCFPITKEGTQVDILDIWWRFSWMSHTAVFEINSVASTVPVDGLALFNANTSGTAMMKLGTYLCTGT